MHWGRIFFYQIPKKMQFTVGEFWCKFLKLAWWEQQKLKFKLCWDHLENYFISWHFLQFPQLKIWTLFWPSPSLRSICRVVFAIGRHLKWAPGVLLLQKLCKQIFFPHNFNLQIFSPQDHFYWNSVEKNLFICFL